MTALLCAKQRTYHRPGVRCRTVELAADTVDTAASAGPAVVDAGGIPEVRAIHSHEYPNSPAAAAAGPERVSYVLVYLQSPVLMSLGLVTGLSLLRWVHVVRSCYDAVVPFLTRASHKECSMRYYFVSVR